MISFSPRPLALLCAALLAGFAGTAHALASDSAMAPADKQLNALYWQGHEALKKSDWNQAFQRFQQLEKQLRDKEPASVDAAVYWQAYALTQAKRNAEAKTTIERLNRDFPDSRWRGDAQNLSRQIEPAPAADAAVGGDDELADIAVQGLMSAPPERALPILKRVLEGKHSLKIKKRALFVLGQIDTPAANDAILAIARNDADTEMRDEAIRMISVGGQDAAIDQLKSVYAAGKTPGVRRAVLQAWLVAGREDLVLGVAKNEPDADLRRDAVHTLGAMGASAELMQLLEASKDSETQRAVVQALGVSGADDELVRAFDRAGDESVRIEILHALGVAGGGDRLIGLYAKATTPALREAVTQGLIISGDQKGLVVLYRQAKTNEEKKALLRAITVLGDDAAIDLIDATLKP